MPLIETKGAASAQGFGGIGASSGPVNYIEDVFSTYLYTGNGSTQTITNGIALAGTAGNTSFTASNGIGFSVDSNENWQYIVNGSAPMQVYKIGQFSTQITLPTNAQLGWGGSCSDASGNNYYGIYYAHTGQRYLHVIKTNPLGDTVLWNRQVYASGSDNYLYSIVTDGTSVYFVGATGSPDYLGVLFSLSCSTGAVNWYKALSITYGVYLYAVTLDSSGNVYVGGYHGGSTGSGHAYLAKYNSSGTLQQQTTFRFNDTSVKSIAVDTSGDIYLGGTDGSQRYYVRKLNSSFAEQWTRTFNPSINQATWIDIGVGSTTLTVIFTDATLNNTYAAVIDKSGNLLSCSSVSGHTSLGGQAGQNKTPTYKNNNLYLLLNKVYVIPESELVANINLFNGPGLMFSSTSVAWTTAGDPSNTTWSYSTTTAISLSITKTTYNPSGTVSAEVEGFGGLVWMKSRSAATNHALYDTVRGATKDLVSNSTAAETTESTGLTSFASTGFSIGALAKINTNADTYVSWTFREQPKFFDVVTYTGNGTNRTISHNLGSVPGCIIVKRTDTSANWQVYHRSLTSAAYSIQLNLTNAEASATTVWNSTAPTSTVFSVGTDSTVNANGGTYVALLFAHNAGGFGLSGTDNVISCGSFTTNGVDGSFSVTTGYEPQWWLVKNTSRPGDWHLVDIMRGATASATGRELIPNLSSAETSNYFVTPTATGFYGTAYDFGGADTYIYIAIRRGPMKVPTSGTSVYTPITRSGNSTATTVTGVGFAPDLVFEAARTNSGGNNWVWFDRLRGGAQILSSDNSGAEVTNSVVIQSDSLSTTMDGFRIQTANPINASGNTYVYYPLKRAPGFFDEVCITGDGTTSKAVPHNLGVVPEIVITKTRNAVGEWYTYVNALWSDSDKKGLNLRTNGAASTTTVDGSGTFPTRATASNFYIGGNSNINGETKVLYLFATCAGVSKVGSYTGTGTTLQVNCGFTGGSRFVLIKRTDSTGDWYVWDSARGIVAGNDSYLVLNSTAAEVTTTDWVDTYSAGFELSSNAGNNVNINTATYIFLAIA